MIEPGEKIDTGITLDIVEDGEEKSVKLSKLLDRPAVFSVYMRNNTPGCDRQNESLAEHSEWFDDRGYRLIAVSKDSCGSHKNYAEKKGINYILASDPEHEFAKATDSIVEKNMYGNRYEAPSRSAFVIDTDGTVLGVIEKVDTRNHAEELRELIETL
ncbi:MAG: redoxin domain-containing protein [Balneolaceae bacterium]|nr:redoxin domain-containing protein [Balneolaceae bacterium]